MTQFAQDNGIDPGPGEGIIKTARLLVATAGHAALASLAADGTPYASLVLVAPTGDGRLLMLLSDLAVHSRNLMADPRASLMIDGGSGPARDLTEPRLTVTGRVAALPPGHDREALLEIFITRHRSARTYAGFGDFRLYAMTPDTLHLVAGFGAIHWLPGSALADPA